MNDIFCLKASNTNTTILIDFEDKEKVFKHHNNWWESKDGFILCRRSKVTNTVVYLHKIITPGVRTDHKEHNRFDNRKSKLRSCTFSQNGGNRLKNKTATHKYKGVKYNYRLDKEYWTAKITCNHKIYCLGCFNTELEAAKAYNKKALELYGEFACLNQCPD